MPKAKEKKTSEAEGLQRNLKHLIEEREKLKAVKAEILGNLAKAEESIDVEAAEELRLHEEALRAGRPGQPSKKLKDAEAQAENLKKQLPTIERLELRLQFEEATLEREAAEEKKKEAGAAMAEVTARLREVTQEHQATANKVRGLQEQERRWREAIAHHRNRLLALGDEEIIAEVEEQNERNAAMVAGMNDPEYKGRQMRALQEAGGLQILESLEDESKYREAVAAEGAKAVISPPSKERGW